MRKTYTIDLSDAGWTRLRSYLPTPKAEVRQRPHSLRDVLDATFYVLKAAVLGGFCPMTVLRGLPFTYHFRRFRLSGLWHLILKVLHAASGRG
jgi:transposase